MSGLSSYLVGFNPRAQPNSYLINLMGLTDLSFRDTTFTNGMAALQEFSLQYSATLFNQKAKGQGTFYGRTYISQPKPLKISPTDPTKVVVDEEDFVYFNTSYIDKTSVLVVELTVIKNSAGKQSFCSAGYAILPIFEFAGESSVMVVKGSPRQIASGESSRQIDQK